ncbi:MAG: hypothetical protein RL264_3006 [Bacteroidota bacterium]|jgi:hypothetical protein
MLQTRILKAFLSFSGMCCLSFGLSAQETLNIEGNFYIFPGAQMGVFSDIVNTGNFESTGGDVYFVGPSQQNVSGNSPVNLYKVILNNSNSLKLDNQLEVGNDFEFINGKVFTDRGDYTTEFLNFLAGATYTGVDNSHFVDGVVRKTGNTAFVFPVGQFNDVQPISIEAPSNATDSYTTYYNWTDPLNDSFDPTIFQTGINNVSRCEYWILNPTSGSPDITFSLNFDINSCGITDPTELIVVRWTGTEWENLGNGGTSGTVDDGIIIKGVTCSSCGTFNPITLGSLTNANPLPVELLNFTAVAFGRKTKLDWQTASEHNNDYFTVERTFDGEHFEIVGTADGSGNSNQLLSYSLFDENPANGYNYYRLKQTDFDGTSKYSDLRSVYFGPEAWVNVYPNPSNGLLNIVATGEVSNFAIYAADGKLVQAGDVNGLITLFLEPGMYFVNFEANGKKNAVKVVVAN